MASFKNRIESGNYTHQDVLKLLDEMNNAEKREYEVLGRANALEVNLAAAMDALRGMLAIDEEHHQRGHDDDDVCAEVRDARAVIGAMDETPNTFYTPKD